MPPRASGLLAMNTGLGIWALCFVLLYVMLSLGCRYGWQAHQILGANALTAGLVILWAAHLAWLAWLILRAARRLRAAAGQGQDTALVRSVTVALHGSALAAAAWTGLPVLVLSPCV